MAREGLRRGGGGGGRALGKVKKVRRDGGVSSGN